MGFAGMMACIVFEFLRASDAYVWDQNVLVERRLISCLQSCFS